MAKQTINIGTADRGDGDPIRTAFNKVNANFTELYTALGLGDASLNLGSFEFTNNVMTTTDSSAVIIDQNVTITNELTMQGDIVPNLAGEHNLGSAAKPWNSLYVSGSTIYIGGNALSINDQGELTFNNNRVAHENGEFMTLDNLSDLNVNSPNAGDTIAWMGSAYVNVPLLQDRLADDGDEVVLVGGANPYVTFPAITGGDQLQISGAEVSALSGNLAFSGQTTITMITNGAGAGGIGSQYFTLGADGSLTIPGTIGSDDEFKIEVNVSDSTKYIWRFGEDGELTFPDGTSQSTAATAGMTASSTNTLTNKTINIQAGQGNVFQIQGNSITSYSGSGAVLALTSMPTFSGMNVNNSSLSMDGGSGSYYWAPTFADGAGTIHKAGVYKSAANANNSLFSFGANGAGTMSVVMDGSLFVGSSLPANNGGLNTDYGGWLVVQAGAKFGGDLNTIGNFILDTPGNYVRFGDGTTQTTAADFGYLDLDKDTIKGTAGYQYTFATDGYFTSSTSSESLSYFFVTYNTTNANIAAGWTVVGGTANTTVSSVTYPVAGYPGVIRVNLTAAASSTAGFYPVTVTSPDRLRVEIQPNPGTSDKFIFTTSGLTFPDASVQTTAYTGTANLATVARNIENEGDVNIRVNLTDSTTRIWRFGEDGDLVFPDATTQSTAYTGNAATVDIMNTNGIDYNYSITFVENRSATQDLRADVDLTYNSATNTLTAANFSGNLTGVADIAKNIENEGDVNIRVNLTDSTQRVWRFGEDGDLTLPNNGVIQETTVTNEMWGTTTTSLTLVPGGATNGTQRLEIYATGAGEGDHIHIRSGDQNQTDLFLGNDTQYFAVAASGANYIQARNGAASTGPGVSAGAGANVNIYGGNAGDNGGNVADGNSGGDVFIASGISTAGLGGDIFLQTSSGPTGFGSIKLSTDGGSSYLEFDKDLKLTTPGAVSVGGILKIDDGVHEKFQTKSYATGVVTHDCSLGHVFYHLSPSANWTVNLTNLNLAVGYATAVTLVIEQGATGRYPSAVQVAGNAVPLAWQGNTTPTPSSNRFDVVTFSILYDGLYTVLGQLTGF